MNKREVLVVGATMLRYGIAESMARRVKNGKPIAAHMVGFIAADILDGVVARRLDADTPIRRTADALVDRAAVARVVYEVVKNNEASRPYIATLAARELVVGTANALHYKNTGEVTQGTGVHKLGTLSLAAFGVAAASGNERLTHSFGLAASVINMALAAEYAQNASGTSDGVLRDGIRQI